MASQSPAENIDNTAYALSWDAMNHLLRSGRSWSGHEINTAFLNLGDGRFKDISQLSGFDFVDDARGVAVVDWDGDGDQDFWLRNRTGPQVRFMNNVSESTNHFVSVRLIGRTSNRDAIGARVAVEAGDRRSVQSVRAGSSFQMQSSKWLHFGLENEGTIDVLTVNWPDGTQSVFADLAADRQYTITQGEAEPRSFPKAPSARFAPSVLPTGHAPSVSEVPLVYRFPLPDLGGELFDGGRISLNDHRGQPILINFWASWCAPCVAELKQWTAAQERIEASGVVVLALSLDEEKDQAAAASLVESLSLPFPAAMADPEWRTVLETALQLVVDTRDQMSIPTSLLIDRTGRLAKIYSGPVEPDHFITDARNLAEGDQNIVMQAAPYSGSIDGLFLPHSIAVRYLQLCEAFIANEQWSLVQWYMSPLLAQIDTYDPPTGTFKRIGTVNRLLAEGIEEAGGDFEQERTRADAFFVQAAQGYAERMRSNPADENAWAELGLCVDGLSESEQAATMVHEILTSLAEPSNLAELKERGRLIFNLRRWREAEPYLRRALEADSADANTRYRLGTAQLRLGNFDEGIPNVERALAELPQLAVAEFNFAGDLERAEVFDLAIEHYRRALELDPAYEPAREALQRLEKLDVSGGGDRP